MKTLNRFSIRTRLIALVAVLLATLVGTTLVARSGFSTTKANSTIANSEVNLERLISAANVAWNANDSANNMYVAVLALNDPTQAKLAEDTWTASADAYKTATGKLAEFSSIAVQADDKAIGTSLKGDLEAYNQFSLKVRELGKKGDVTGALKVMTVENLDASLKLGNDLNNAVTALANNGQATSAKVVSTSESSSKTNTVFFVIGLVLAIALSFVLIRSFTQPIATILAMLKELAAGDLSARNEVIGSDEFAQIGIALNTAAENLESSKVREDEAREKDADTRMEILSNASTLAAASEELTAVATTMSIGAEETASQASVLSTVSDQISTNTHTVAAALEEMQASISEIARGAVDASQTAVEAVQLAHSTKDVIATLGESSAAIDQVVEAISSIAEDTNMLALNATIEAARAGEAGKGFAVVATEVKELANETAKATHDIKARIQAIQAETRTAISAIEEVAHVVDRINDSQQMIAASVEEQSATTQEMVRSITEVATGIGEVSHNVRGMVETAQSTANGANETLHSAAELAELAQSLQTMSNSGSSAAV